MASCGAELEANRLYGVLAHDPNDPNPQVPPVPLKAADITNGDVDGPGVFDLLMRGFKAHLQKEWDDGRITGDDYTKAYIALTDSAMQQGVAFLLGKDQSYWSGQSERANYALMKMKISTEEVTYCTAKYNLEQALPKNVANLTLQGNMLKEQTEAQRAQTMDTRIDGAPVTGVLGKQKALYAQQIISYERDAELKAARLWSDAWITQKTIDEGLTPPTEFTNANVNTILTSIRQKNGL